MKRLGIFLKRWTLIISMIIGVLCSLLIPQSDFKDALDAHLDPLVQVSLFTMLLLSFTEVSPKQIKFSKWHFWHLSFQVIISVFLLIILSPLNLHIAKAVFLCFICPTAVAAAVITDKLGGKVSSIVSYTVFINCATSVVIPIVLPFISVCVEENSFIFMVFYLMKRIFPLLVGPMLLIWTIRYTMPRLHNFLHHYRWLSFYLWAFTVVVVITKMTDSLLKDGHVSLLEYSIMGVSCLSCIIQFRVGRWIGNRYNDTVSAGQALGQKNTVFAIWAALTMIDPFISVAPGSYVIWQNLINSYELAYEKKEDHN